MSYSVFSVENKSLQAKVLKMERQMEKTDLWMQGWEGEGGMNGESSTDTYIPSCVKQTAGGKLLYNREPSTVLLMTWRGGLGEESEAQEGEKEGRREGGKKGCRYNYG